MNNTDRTLNSRFFDLSLVWGGFFFGHWGVAGGALRVHTPLLLLISAAHGPHGPEAECDVHVASTHSIRLNKAFIHGPRAQTETRVATLNNRFGFCSRSNQGITDQIDLKGQEGRQRPADGQHGARPVALLRAMSSPRRSGQRSTWRGVAQGAWHALEPRGDATASRSPMHRRSCVGAALEAVAELWRSCRAIGACARGALVDRGGARALETGIIVRPPVRASLARWRSSSP